MTKKELEKQLANEEKWAKEIERKFAITKENSEYILWMECSGAWTPQEDKHLLTLPKGNTRNNYVKRIFKKRFVKGYKMKCTN